MATTLTAPVGPSQRCKVPGGHRFLGRPEALLRRGAAAHCPRARRDRSAALVVEANELNRWANRDASEGDGDLEEDTWDGETAAVLLRVLTARAVQRVLGQLSETDILVAQWLNNYCSDPKNNPSAGNAFLLGLFGAQGAVVTENHTGTLHTIDPPGLARRIILVRADMAASLYPRFPSFVEAQNTSVMVQHLQRNTYTTGEYTAGDRGRRGYIRPRSSRG